MVSRIIVQLRKIVISQYLKSNHITFATVPNFIGRWPRFANQGRIILGDRCRFREYRIRHYIAVINPDAVLELDDRCFLSDGVNICASKRIFIGADTRVAPNVTIFDTNFHQVNEGDDVFEAEVVIEKNVWVGINSVILPGVHIGAHSVIGAYSVVTHDVPAKTLAAGNPAKPIKEIRCSDDWVRQ